MPKFEVSVARTIVLTTLVDVSAKNEDEAEDKAKKLASKRLITWNIEDKLDWQEDSDDVTVYSAEEL